MSKGANVYWTIEQIKAYMSVQLHRGKEYPTDFLAGIFTVILDQVLEGCAQLTLMPTEWL